MTNKTLSKADLAHFTGSEIWYTHSIVRSICYTDGVRYVAQTGGAYWLIDEIVFGQEVPSIKSQQFQVWHLNVENNSAVLTCSDGDGNSLLIKKIEYTDFPLDEIRFYSTDRVILLPSEY